MFFRVKIQLKNELIFKEHKHADTIWIFANNPETAKMRAIRWHSTFQPGRANSYEDKDIYGDLRDPKEVMKLTPKDHVIYQYAVWYKIRPGRVPGNKVVAFSFGENQIQARKMARKYFPIIVESKDEMGIHCVERIKSDKESNAK